MISFDAGVLADAVNGRSPYFSQARALVEGLFPSREVILIETELIALYGALRRVGRDESARVIRVLRKNPNWRIVDVQSSRVLMDPVWEVALSEGCGLDEIRRRRLIQCLRQNGVTTFYTVEADSYLALGFAGAKYPYAK